MRLRERQAKARAGAELAKDRLVEQPLEPAAPLPAPARRELAGRLEQVAVVGDRLPARARAGRCPRGR